MPNYINGKFCHHREDFASYNPSTGIQIGRYPQSTSKEVNDAISAARNALPSWRATSRIKRADCFDRLCQILKVKTDDITNLISRETGKPLNESRAEVIESLHMAQYCFARGRTSCGEIIPSELPERDAYVIRKPKGVVGIISPWNFPFCIGGFWSAGPALVEGNTVVLKPSELTPEVGVLISELYDMAGFPSGVFNMIQGDGSTGEFVVDGDVDHICFTGSAQVGMKIRTNCAQSWHKTCSCEMGSKSAVVVFDDCDRGLAIAAVTNSALKLSGQRCVSTGRVLVQRNICDQFAEQLVAEMDKAVLCDPFSSNIDRLSYGPIISEEQLKRVESYNQAVAKDEDVKIYRMGRRQDCSGYFLTPTVYQCEWTDKHFLKEEVFGPHLAIIPFDTIDDAIRIYNDTPYGLALGVLTDDFRKARRMRDECDFGMAYWNLGSIAAESQLPFGGVKKSGNGGSSAAGMFDTVSNKVTWTVNHAQTLNFPQGLK